MKAIEPGGRANTNQSCTDCEHASHVAPFKVYCKAGEGMLGDMYASGMLTNGSCIKNRKPTKPPTPEAP